MKKPAPWFLGVALMTVMSGTAALAAGTSFSRWTDRPHTLLAAEPKPNAPPPAKKPAKNEPPKVVLSDEDTKWLKEHYSSIINSGNAIKKKKENAEQAKAKASGKKKKAIVASIDKELKRTITQWKKSYKNIKEEKKADVLAAEKSLEEARVKLDKAKAANSSSDIQFNEKLVGEREVAAKKLLREYEILQELTGVLVEEP